MAEQAGHLLINRLVVTLPAGTTVVDTGLRQTNLNTDPDPPVFGVTGVIASRVMVVPVGELFDWTNITHTEPRESATGTVEVEFTNSGQETFINVMFWLPHTHFCPVSADTYNGGD